MSSAYFGFAKLTFFPFPFFPFFLFFYVLKSTFLFQLNSTTFSKVGQIHYSSLTVCRYYRLDQISSYVSTLTASFADLEPLLRSQELSLKEKRHSPTPTPLLPALSSQVAICYFLLFTTYASHSGRITNRARYSSIFFCGCKTYKFSQPIFKEEVCSIKMRTNDAVAYDIQWWCLLPRVRRILGERSTIHSLPALFFIFLMEISLRTLIPLFRPGSVHSGSAS